MYDTVVCKLPVEGSPEYRAAITASSQNEGITEGVTPPDRIVLPLEPNLPRLGIYTVMDKDIRTGDEDRLESKKRFTSKVSSHEILQVIYKLFSFCWLPFASFEILLATNFCLCFFQRLAYWFEL